ncbi:MAG: hypothetical protein H6605_00635 [Flavobacteriales bacterium]|nr:hypothetical protein [Flavobacteriales bacterium]
MKLNKENYEFLLFELLEGNLTEEDANKIKTEIEADPFYSKEWELMQQTILSPEKNICMPEKEAMLVAISVPAYKIHFVSVLKIAASFVLISSVIFYFYKQRSDLAQQDRTELSDNRDPIAANDQKINNEEVPLIDNIDQNKRVSPIIPSQFANTKHKRDVRSTQNKPTGIKANQWVPFEMNVKKVDLKYSGSYVQNVAKTENLNLEYPHPNAETEGKNLIVKFNRIQKTTLLVLRDIPNISVKMTPNLKAKKPSLGFELKGNTVYANALIQVK